MGSEVPNSDSGWDYPLTDEDLRAIDSAFAAAAASAPPSKRHALSYSDEENSSVHSPPKTRRRLPDSLFVFQKQQNNNRLKFGVFVHIAWEVVHLMNFTRMLNFRLLSEIKFGGRTIYSRTVEEVERAAEELLEFVEVKKRKEDQCIFGLDIEWRPTFRRGVAPGKAAVLQICGENSCCYVLHIIHSQIPKSLQRLLEDQTSIKVGVAIANDAAKVSQDYNVSIKTLEDLSDLANRKLGGEPKKWSLSTLTEMLTCRQGLTLASFPLLTCCYGKTAKKLNKTVPAFLELHATCHVASSCLGLDNTKHIACQFELIAIHEALAFVDSLSEPADRVCTPLSHPTHNVCCHAKNSRTLVVVGAQHCASTHIRPLFPKMPLTLSPMLLRPQPTRPT
ncbi:UNVERIFIED_CONTAM: Werner Syndrome-like exonuclease [Sesamum calycinum]|uniref:3'-5' exonuclease n=1 Tax=Sesamum calycinum TaxID=2727403 RepID=A0AAW2RRC5_9LAMI